MNSYLIPHWPTTNKIRAFCTTRHGGYSKFPYDSFNLSLNTRDNESDVLSNRKKLRQELYLKQEPFWLRQQHTNVVICVDNYYSTVPPIADASFSRRTNIVCAVLTADCIPILVCNRQETLIGAIHAGWKGILGGVIEQSIQSIAEDPENLLIWLGPAIGPTAFQVGKELVENFCNKIPQYSQAFSKWKDKYLANIYQLAIIQLKQLGVQYIYGGNYCTFSQQNTFYSYRRDGINSGRMASLIWIRA